MKTFIYRLFKTSLLIFFVGFIGSCGGGSSSSSSVPPEPETPQVVELKPDTTPDPALPRRNSAQWDQAVEASRFLAQASFGATAKDIDFILKHGKEAWLDRQMKLPQTSHLEFLDKRLKTFGFEPAPPYVSFEDSDSVWVRHILQQDIWWESAIWGQDQLRQRIAFALSQILVISHHGANLYARERGFAHYQDILAKHAFGNYENLLFDISLNPMMGIYLSAINNPKEDVVNNIRPDENYAREILQLFSIGLYELNSDSSHKTDAQNNLIPTYNQETIKAFARIFTGFSLSKTSQFAEFGLYAPPQSNVEPMKAYAEFHDSGEKTLLNNEKIAAGKIPVEDVRAAIRNIMAHDNVAPFICKKLIQYLVTSNPSLNYVGRITKVFNDNSKGVKGDMKAVIKAIYLDQEAQGSNNINEAIYGKRREYPLLVSNIWRAFKAQGIQLNWKDKSVQTIRYRSGQLNDEQEPFWAPSVFNFYQSDYSPPGLLSNHSYVAPEFQVFNESSAVLQANLLAQLIYNRDIADTNLWTGTGQQWGTIASWNNPPVKARLNLTEELALARQPLLLVDRLNLLLAQGQLSDTDIQLIANHIGLIDSHLGRIYEAVFLIAVSPEFAIQR